MKRQSNPLIGPDDAAALWRESEHVRRASITVTCQLITPMSGGGVAAGEVDRTMPIRGSALRGQLRFWWRLLNGRGRNSKDLFREERDLWGGIGADDPKASMVGLRVACDPPDGFLKRKSELAGFPNYVLILERGEENHERMASPLILRPYFDGSGFRAMALLLPDWRNRISVPVKFKDSDRSGQAWPLGEDERSRLAGDVTPVARGNDPLTAFMHYFADFTERTGAKRGRR